MSDKERNLIRSLADKSPQQLRDIIYDNMPGTMGQIKKLFKTRGDLLLAAIEIVNNR